jgi:hypothetical protein
MDLESSLMQETLEPSLEELGHRGVTDFLAVGKIINHFNKIEILPNFVGH